MEFRRATDPLQTREDAVEKLATEPGPLFLVPAEASGCVGSRIRCEANLNRHGAVPAAERSSHPRTGPTPDGKRDWPGALSFGKLPRVDGHVFRLARDIIPKILDQLEFLGGGEAEDRACIGCHGNCSAAVVIAYQAPAFGVAEVLENSPAIRTSATIFGAKSGTGADFGGECDSGTGADFAFGLTAAAADPKTARSVLLAAFNPDD